MDKSRTIPPLAMRPQGTGHGVVRFVTTIATSFYHAAVAWSDHRAGSKGAALAFYVLFSMAPLLVVVMTIAGLFYDPQIARAEILGQIGRLVGAQGASAVETLLTSSSSRHSSGVMAWVASLALLLGATTAFAELKSSLDEIWGMPEKARAGWLILLRTRFLAFGLILTLTFLALVSLLVDAALGIVQRFWADTFPIAANILAPLSTVFSLLVITLLFAVIYKFLPEKRLAWREVLAGACFTAILFAAGKYGIGIYLGNTPTLSVYGAASAMVALLLWLYYSAQIFFFGAELTRQYVLYTDARYAQQNKVREQQVAKIQDAR
ncbi:hypothetical protein IGB42_02283 [Andreprevotia sp. IGB-42]|uniref:YihY/virulence factor BrkB family protein n=1 Tax=Andreprevotia sp. IGB-42 TaxID=2497473 RepID=UPI00157F010C|nr:YihY/virulence factor BrkB family protein [Andreprevotia sp. IGB-42]KAF0813354.1 hypothetical protein IGB42_02283 [Andreprevotia sp. IGB-42]